MDAYIFDFDGTLANSGSTGILATQENGCGAYI